MSLGRAMDYLDAMPRLRAQENMALATAVGMGSGTLKDDARRKISRDWERLAGHGEPARRAMTKDEVIKRALAAGLAVEVRKPKIA